MDMYIIVWTLYRRVRIAPRNLFRRKNTLLF